jgi:hypothetical protein
MLAANPPEIHDEPPRNRWRDEVIAILGGIASVILEGVSGIILVALNVALSAHILRFGRARRWLRLANSMDALTQRLFELRLRREMWFD